MCNTITINDYNHQLPVFPKGPGFFSTSLLISRILKWNSRKCNFPMDPHVFQFVVGWLVGWSVKWSVGLSVGWLVGRLVGRLVGWSVGWLVG